MDTEIILDWPYDEALLWMEQAHLKVKQEPLKIFIACGSHKDHVITLGRHCSLGDLDHRLNDFEGYLIRQIERGGKITAHEPGQLVLYPVFNPSQYSLTLTTVIEILEDTMIMFLANIGITGSRLPKGQGIYVGDEKIGFLGLRIKDQITSHGLSLNVLNSAHLFKAFDPCGMKNQAITSAKYHQVLTLPLLVYAERLLKNLTTILRSKLLMRANDDGHHF